MQHNEPYSVSELTLTIKTLLEGTFTSVTARGEISNWKRASSGHIYFTLKDDGAQLPAVMWRSAAGSLPEGIEDGVEVVARGKVEVYPPQGKYQLITATLRPVGEGILQKEFQRLFQKLEREGLFLDTHKKTVPVMPMRIGIVTSGTGAVIEDIRNVFYRRNPSATLMLAPVKVQGEGASREIVNAIRYFNRLKETRPEVLIVGRGGGSLEDLWAFNEEAVARAIFASDIPIISAVGHQTDFTIADYVADSRAGTPSMAAEIISPKRGDILRTLSITLSTAYQQVMSAVLKRQDALTSILNSYAFNAPKSRVNTLMQQLDYLSAQSDHIINMKLKREVKQLSELILRLDALNPEAVLRRGYAIIKTDQGIIDHAAELKRDEVISIHFQDGRIAAKVIEELLKT